MSEFEIPETWINIERDGVQLTIPPDWEMVEDAAVIIAAAGPREDEEMFRPNINVVVGGQPGADGVLEDLVADEFGALANVLIELQAIDTEMFTLNDREWARTLLAYRGATHPLTLEQRTTLTSAGSTVVSATVDTNDWAALEQLVTAILDSVTFVDEETAPDE